jgi:hypothetical protein
MYSILIPLAFAAGTIHAWYWYCRHAALRKHLTNTRSYAEHLRPKDYTGLSDAMVSAVKCKLGELVDETWVLQDKFWHAHYVVQVQRIQDEIERRLGIKK